MRPIFITGDYDNGSFTPRNLHLFSKAVGTADMTVADGMATFSKPLPQVPELSDITFNTGIYRNADFCISFTVDNNTDDDFTKDLFAVLLDPADNTTVVAVADTKLVTGLYSGESREFTLTSSFTGVANGTYGFAIATRKVKASPSVNSDAPYSLMTADTPTQYAYSVVSPVTTTEVTDAPTGTFAISTGTPELSAKIDRGQTYIATSVPFTCTGGIGKASVRVQFYKKVNGSYNCLTLSDASVMTEAGKSGVVELKTSIDGLEVGQTYYYVVFVNTGSGFVQQNNLEPFTLTDENTTSISRVEADKAAISVEYYNLTGAKVSPNTAPGHYIKVTTLSDGTRRAEHIITR